MTSWHELLSDAMQEVGESLADLVANTLTDEELDVAFDDGFGGEEGQPFTAWSTNYVYFPACYDGSEWVSSVPRNPCSKKTEHVGGG